MNDSPSEDAELEELRALSAEIAAAENSPWEPQCIARAFAPPRGGVLFTMAEWLALSAVKSPLLQDAFPETADDLAAVGEVFRLDLEALTADELMAAVRGIKRAVNEAFAMSLPMSSPGAEHGSQEEDGFGAWLPLWAFLVVQCGLSPDAALALGVGRAFALMAGTRRNQGWKTGGTPYAWRDLEKEAARG